VAGRIVLKHQSERLRKVEIVTFSTAPYAGLRIEHALALKGVSFGFCGRDHRCRASHDDLGVEPELDQPLVAGREAVGLSR